MSESAEMGGMAVAAGGGGVSAYELAMAIWCSFHRQKRLLPLHAKLKVLSS